MNKTILILNCGLVGAMCLLCISSGQPPKEIVARQKIYSLPVEIGELLMENNKLKNELSKQIQDLNIRKMDTLNKEEAYLSFNR